MVALGRIAQTVLSLVSSTPLGGPSVPASTPSKSIAIVGGGTGGLGALKALLDLPEDVRQDWHIDLFEKRSAIGGVWWPDPNPPNPPVLPETPLYPALRTNTPHPTMTWPHFPYPPETVLYPHHYTIQTYHEAFAVHYGLVPHIHLQHNVMNAYYTPDKKWAVDILYDHGKYVNLSYDHIIFASGHNHYPREPTWPGQDEWLLAGDGQRRILHSIYYREPEKYKRQTVVVVGDGASGRDMAQQIVPFADAVYHSYSNDTVKPIKLPPVPGTIYKPRISHFTRTSIIFTDGSTINLRPQTPTTVLLGTGYELRIPCLEELSINTHLDTERSNLTLATNLRYIRPLYRQVLTLDPDIPRNALGFVGLPVWIANAPSSYAQGLFLAHAIADSSILPSTEEMLRELEDHEEALRRFGIDPLRYGHGFPGEGSSADYQDDLIAYLRANSSIPLPSYLSDPYVEPWRRSGREDAFLLRRGWLRAEEQGIEEQFIKGARTEEDWVEAMQRVREWELQQEEAEKLLGVEDAHHFLDSPL